MQNKTLLHFTGRNKTDDEAFGILKKILETSELLLSYCPTFAKEIFEKQFVMACFTDPDKVNIKQHHENFGRFAVAFKRKEMEEYGANPVLYITPTNLKHIESQIGLLRKFEDLNKDRDWKEEMEPYQFSEEELLSFYFTTGLSEWRILYQPDLYQGLGREHDPGIIRPSTLNDNLVGYMKFRKEDVSHIFVPQGYTQKAKDEILGTKIEKI